MANIGASSGKDHCGIGITNQREKTIVWEKRPGKPVYNAIVWQCRRDCRKVEELVKDGFGEKIHKKQD